MKRMSLFAGLFFVAAIAMTGMPPLSGFIGKLFILDAGRGSAASVWIWATVLSTSLVVTLAFARAGSVLFWKIDVDAPLVETKAPAPLILPVAVCVVLLGATVLLSALAGPVKRELDATARQTLDPKIYVRAVLAPSAPQAGR
jgi:multicomponent K+:H+ antiporter subunit D